MGISQSLEKNDLNDHLAGFNVYTYIYTYNAVAGIVSIKAAERPLHNAVGPSCRAIFMKASYFFKIKKTDATIIEQQERENEEGRDCNQPWCCGSGEIDYEES